MVSARDRRNLDEIAEYSGRNKTLFKVLFIVRFFKNWILERLASSFPIPSWRVGLHRLRGIKIGKGVYIGYGVVFDRIYPELITIEDYVEIGDNCIISVHSHGPAPLKDLYPRIVAPVRIEKSVWIPPGCIILQGVTIGERSVIGTGAVVNKSIPPFSVAVGIPAKVIKKLDVGDERKVDITE